MEGGKKSGLSDLLALKGSSGAAASSEILESIFAAPAAKVIAKESPPSTETEKKPDSGHQRLSLKSILTGNHTVTVDGHGWTTDGKDLGLCMMQENALPFHYGSSIHYGGRDDYSPPESDQNNSYTFNKDMGEVDPDRASRGNWWQGSLYY